jgi:hypothetical protein
MYKDYRPGGHLQFMLKTGTERYQLRTARVEGVMEPWDSDDLVRELTELGFVIVDTDERAATSPHEFDHPKLMVIGRLLDARCHASHSR